MRRCGSGMTLINTFIDWQKKPTVQSEHMRKSVARLIDMIDGETHGKGLKQEESGCLLLTLIGGRYYVERDPNFQTMRRWHAE